MARRVIDFDDWQRTRALVEARAKRIASFFDLDKLRRKPREAAKDAWLKAHGQGSRFQNAEPPSVLPRAMKGR